MKNRRETMRQTFSVAAVIMLAFSVFYSVILNTVVSTEAVLCGYQAIEEDDCADSCCCGDDCCCYFSDVPTKTETLISYESFGKSIYNNMCAVRTFDNSNLAELYSIDSETQFSPNNIIYEIFRPPKA